MRRRRGAAQLPRGCGCRFGRGERNVRPHAAALQRGARQGLLGRGDELLGLGRARHLPGRAHHAHGVDDAWHHCGGAHPHVPPGGARHVGGPRRDDHLNPRERVHQRPLRHHLQVQDRARGHATQAYDRPAERRQACQVLCECVAEAALRAAQCVPVCACVCVVPSDSDPLTRWSTQSTSPMLSTTPCPRVHDAATLRRPGSDPSCAASLPYAPPRWSSSARTTSRRPPSCSALARCR